MRPAQRVEDEDRVRRVRVEPAVGRVGQDHLRQRLARYPDERVVDRGEGEELGFGNHGNVTLMHETPGMKGKGRGSRTKQADGKSMRIVAA